MFRGHNNIICGSLRLYPYKNGLYKMFVISLHFAYTKNTKSMSKGMTYRTEQVFDRIFNDSDSDKGNLLC